MGKGAGSGGRSAGVASKGVDSKRVVTPEELASHSSMDDAWIAWAGRVYDVSNWRAHPGGDVLFTHAGKDATDVFAAFHPQSAYDLMERFYVGRLEGAAEGSHAEFEKELRGVRAQLVKEGYFESSILYYWYKFSTTVAFGAAAVYVALSYDSFAMHMASAALLGVFFQQCGWLAHDYSHHQVFRWRLLGDLMGWLVGNVFQGFSVEWWKNKHNTHHAIPNLHESAAGAHDGDPDIDTMPILAWSKKLLAQAPGGWHLKYQSLLFLPILLAARLAWMQQSFLFIFGFELGWGRGAYHKAPAMGLLEPAGLLLHYIWFAALLACMPLSHALPYALLSNGLGGLLIGIAFGVGHNGMALYEYDNTPGFGVLQLSTTRNVDDNGFTGWFMGGLHYQIEHHMFPSLPRHSLWKAASLVRPLAAKHGLPYRSTGLWEGNLEVMAAMDKVVEGIAEFPAM